MMKTQPSYKTRGLSNGTSVSIGGKNKSSEESTQQNYMIYGGLGVGLLLIILLYLTFGGSTFRGQSIVIGQERISQLSEDKRLIPIRDKYTQVLGQKIFYRECKPLVEVYNTVDLLFLHGNKYSSVTWKGLGTLQIFASFGYKSIAVDLPGYGLSKVIPYNQDVQRIAFIQNFINNIGLRKVVIISPSMSGDYSIPVLMSTIDQQKSLNFDLNGVVAIAPTHVNSYSKVDYQKVHVPVLVMWGERDRSEIAKDAQYHLTNIPDSEQVMIERAQHAAFVGNPQQFHSAILEFLQERCKLSKDDYEDDFDFGDDWDWDNTYSDTFGGNDNYDIDEFFDSYTNDLSYDFDNDDSFLDDHFDFDDSQNYWTSDDTTSDTITSDDTTFNTNDDDTTSDTITSDDTSDFISNSKSNSKTVDTSDDTTFDTDTSNDFSDDDGIIDIGADDFN